MGDGWWVMGSGEPRSRSRPGADIQDDPATFSNHAALLTFFFFFKFDIPTTSPCYKPKNTTTHYWSFRGQAAGPKASRRQPSQAPPKPP